MRILVALFFMAVRVIAADRSKPIDAMGGGPEPNHLTPIDSRLGAYSTLLEQRLHVVGGDYGTFEFRPSFSGEMHVAVYSVNSDKTFPSEPKTFGITVTQAEKSLWYAMSENNEAHQSKPVRVNRFGLAIDRELAVAIQRAWAAMIMRTRYPSQSVLGTDGFTAEFSVFVAGLGQIRGETWTPEHGLPKEFVDLGFAVADYAKTAEKDRPMKHAKLLAHLRSFERRAHRE